MGLYYRIYYRLYGADFFVGFPYLCPPHEKCHLRDMIFWYSAKLHRTFPHNLGLPSFFMYQVNNLIPKYLICVKRLFHWRIILDERIIHRMPVLLTLVLIGAGKLNELGSSKPNLKWIIYSKGETGYHGLVTECKHTSKKRTNCELKMWQE